MGVNLSLINTGFTIEQRSLPLKSGSLLESVSVALLSEDGAWPKSATDRRSHAGGQRVPGCKLLNRTFIQRLILPAAMLFASLGTVSANLIINGGFEDAPSGGNNPKGATFGGTAYYANSVPVGPLNGWTFGYDGTLDGFGGTPQVEWYSDTQKKYWNAAPAGGHYAVELNSDSFRGRIYAQPTLSQSLQLGQTYTLTFDLAPEAGVTTHLTVTTAVIIDGVEHDFVVSTTSDPASTWTHESLSFVATSQNPTIRFYDGVYVPDVNGNFYNDINLDNISLNPAVVPEPTTLIAGAALLLPFGFQIIGHLRRRRQGC